MFTFPEIDPVLVSIGPLKVHWYGIMYLLGFSFAWYLGTLRAAKSGSGWTKDDVGDLIFYGAMGLIIGARVGYMLFYNFGSLLSNPLNLFKVWEGGMSFHGGLIGVMTGLFFLGRKQKRTFLAVTDFLVPLAPLGLLCGRAGNFINGELWGRVTDVPWGMVFPNAGYLPRHPSQLYEASLEGVALFIMLWMFSSKPRPLGAVSGFFLLFYGIFRSSVEFFREPDAHMGFIAFDWMTQGQLLSLPMIIFGLCLILLAKPLNSQQK